MIHSPTVWRELAAQLRADSIRSTTKAGSGHPTSCLSASDLMAVLLSEHLYYDFNDPHNLVNDRLIFSKGHAAPLLYAMYKAAGAISDEEMMTLREHGSRIEGHPTPILPWVDVATGSLGQGLPTAVGMAYSAKYFDKLPNRIWTLLGDSEMAEGSVYEAMALAGHYKLDNLIAIVDMNRLGQRGTTMLEWHGDIYSQRANAFGWHYVVFNGQSVEACNSALTEALMQRKPVFLIAKTQKGAGVSFLADKENWHGKALSPDDAQKALEELGNPACVLIIKPQPPRNATLPVRAEKAEFVAPSYEIGTKVATREAYGDGLVALGAANENVVVLDGEVSNSTYADRFKKAYPDRFVEVYIAEQQLVSAAVGMQALQKIPFCSTFGAFFSRAFDQIRMAAISRANIALAGSHAGVSIGEDGASQMALEDIAMMRAVYGSTVLYPSCAVCGAKLLGEMAGREGITYLRTTREKTPVLYAPEETFPIGGSKTLRQSENDVVCLIGAGITLHECLKAADALGSEGIAARVIDLYSIKPIDEETLHKAATECGANFVVVEDHWVAGGIGEAVLAVFGGKGSPKINLTSLAVRSMPSSGKPAEMLEAAGISAAHIIHAAKSSLEA